MNIRFLVGLIGLASFVLGESSSATRVFKPPQQNQERSIGRLPTERNEPISIRAVKVNGRKVLRNRKFVADDDWLGGLAINIRNRSDKVILLATIQLQFPRPPGSEGPIAVDEIFYGNYELSTRRPNAAENLRGLLPGESAEITLPVGELEGLRILLEGNGYPSSPEKMHLRIGRVVFNDNTMWQRGSVLGRDKRSPDLWTEIEMPGLSKNTSLKTSISQRKRETEYPRFQYSLFWPERLFSNVSYAPTSAPPAQSGCHRFFGHRQSRLRNCWLGLPV